jgi:phosphinothricin acetyltransferase
MSAPTVRRAILADAAGVNAIYNPVIRDSAATFEVVEHTEEDRRRWLAELDRSPRHPVFVAEAGGKIAGYANAAAFDPRAAYETSVKVSVFVAPDSQGQGVGKALYAALFAAIAAADVHRAYALIVAPNAASVALHEAFGFQYVSTLNEVGRKFGRFHDVMWFEKRL